MKKKNSLNFLLKNPNPMGLLRFLAFICLGFWICSCILNLDDYSDFTTLASLGETSPPDSNWLYIDLDESYYKPKKIELKYEISTTEEFGDTRSDRKRSSGERSLSNCEVRYLPNVHPADSASKDLYCILDIMEHDFYLKDLVIKYNIPKGMCHTVITKTPWHYNQKVGKGPEVIYECEVIVSANPEEDGGCDEQKEKRYFLNGCPTPPSGDCQEHTSKGSEKQENFCSEFDRTEQDLGNCCFGEYQVIKEDSTAENKKWQSNLKDCIGGPGRTSWSAYDDQYGLPIDLIQEADSTLNPLDGYNISYTIKNTHAATGGQAYSSAPMANYIQSLDADADEVPGQVNRLLSKVGSVVGLPEGAPNSPLFKPNFFFTVECKDAAGETPHTLHLMIREWNTKEEFEQYFEAGGDSGYNPDISGEEGKRCDYDNERLSTKYNSEDCNDFLDLDDYLDLPGELSFPHLLYK